MSKMSSWLKAGLIGAAAVLVLELLSFTPHLACATLILVGVAYGCVGALAAYWMPPRRLPARAAGHGAVAGAITGTISEIVGPILVLVNIGALGRSGDSLVYLLLDPYGLRKFCDDVVTPIAVHATCQLLSVAIAAGLAALGGVVFAAIQPD